MVALPGQLFYSTQIPACLWFLARNKNTCSFLIVAPQRGYDEPEILFYAISPFWPTGLTAHSQTSYPCGHHPSCRSNSRCAIAMS
jgi:hypothetical protein